MEAGRGRKRLLLALGAVCTASLGVLVFMTPQFVADAFRPAGEAPHRVGPRREPLPPLEIAGSLERRGPEAQFELAREIRGRGQPLAATLVAAAPELPLEGRLRALRLLYDHDRAGLARYWGVFLSDSSPVVVGMALDLILESRDPAGCLAVLSATPAGPGWLRERWGEVSGRLREVPAR